MIVFDEAQLLPVCHLRPCVGVIANLTASFRSTAVLCTATQPALSELVKSFCPEQEIRELCPEVMENARRFQRVTFRNGGVFSDEALAGELSRQTQVLCVVNTRAAAQRIYSLLPPEGRWHLSTLMTPAHRKKVLETVRARLKAGLTCRVVSTSLIEAGVDVDFPAVYREFSGLDSIAQAAGRCNREGKRPAEESVVTYFEGETPVPLLQRVNVEAAREALSGDRGPNDPETMQRYFTALLSLNGDCPVRPGHDPLDKSGAVEHLRSGLQGCCLPFESVARDFHLIDAAACTVYIPYQDERNLCGRLLERNASREDYRRAGQYSVSVYEQHFQALYSAGDVQLLSEDSAVLINMKLYDSEKGMSLQADTGRADFV